MKEVLTSLYYSKVRLTEVVTNMRSHSWYVIELGRPAPNNFKSQDKSMNESMYSTCLNI